MAGLLNSGRGMALGVGLLSGGNFRNALARGGQNMMAYDEQQRRAKMQQDRMGLLRGADARAQQMHDLGISQATAQAEEQRREMEGMGQVRSHLLLNPGDYTGAVQNATKLPVKTGMSLLAQASELTPKGFTLTGGQARYDADGNVIAERKKPIDHNKPFLPDGSPNEAYQRFATKKAKAGATNVTVGEKGNNELAKAVAAATGKAVVDGWQSARGAASSIKVIDGVIGALDSGAITGIGGGIKTKLKQVAVALGVEGKDDKELLRNTRTAMMGLSRLSVEAGKMMQGQGQITDGERALLDKAASAKIHDMTEGELRQAMIVLRKVNRLTIELSNQSVDQLPKGVGASQNILRVAPVDPYKPAPLLAPAAQQPPSNQPAAPQLTPDQIDAMPIDGLIDAWK